MKGAKRREEVICVTVFVRDEPFLYRRQLWILKEGCEMGLTEASSVQKLAFAS